MKATTIAFVANKDGVTKTSQSILTSNALGACGKNVITIDMDFNNSTTHYYLNDDDTETIKRCNIAKAIASDDEDLWHFTISTLHQGVSIIPSSRKLCDFRGMTDLFRLKMLVEKTGNVDFIIIDCQTNYDNLTINAINAADYIITPVFKNMDSVNAAIFLSEKLQTETNKYDNWFINICGYNKLYEAAESGKQKEYLDVFTDTFKGHFTAKEAWLPWTSDVDDYKDRHMYLSDKKIPRAIHNPALYNSVLHLASCFTDEELERPEYF